MPNLDKLQAVFAQVLAVPPERINDHLVYGDLGWTSVAHMAIVAGIEGCFDIMLDTPDVLAMNGFVKAKEILGKHGIEFGA